MKSCILDTCSYSFLLVKKDNAVENFRNIWTDDKVYVLVKPTVWMYAKIKIKNFCLQHQNWSGLFIAVDKDDKMKIKYRTKLKIYLRHSRVWENIYKLRPQTSVKTATCFTIWCLVPHDL